MGQAQRAQWLPDAPEEVGQYVFDHGPMDHSWCAVSRSRRRQTCRCGRPSSGALSTLGAPPARVVRAAWREALTAAPVEQALITARPVWEREPTSTCRSAHCDDQTFDNCPDWIMPTRTFHSSFFRTARLPASPIRTSSLTISTSGQ